MIYVTHDQEDALTLATNIALLHGGIVEQVGTPLELYQAPQTRYVAEFLGSANILPCQLQSAAKGLIEITLPCAPGQRFLATAPGGTETEGSILCLRPENLSLAKHVSSGTPSIPAVVRHVSFKGSHLDIECETNTGERILSRAPTNPAAERYHEGDRVFLSWSVGAGVVLNESSPI
jgi:ABC-type Fe3+/spermidine/putrescine transport system ATPase subunit